MTYLCMATNIKVFNGQESRLRMMGK